MKRVINFNSGPAAFPLSVLETAQKELLSYQGLGMSILEMSHRSKEFEKIRDNAEALIRELIPLNDEWAVLFMPGGATQQFAMIPMNFLKPKAPIDFVHTGTWTDRAMKEIKTLGEFQVVASSENSKFTSLPEVKASQFHANASYIHYCSNNTIEGTQWKSFVRREDVPVVVDMSSDFLSRKIDLKNFDCIFAGAQKNIGPSGMAVVLIRKKFLSTANENIPFFFKYQSHVDADSLLNTPSTINIYLIQLCLEWLKKEGGIPAIEKRNEEKAKILYSAIDQSKFFTCPIPIKDRSLMNVVFRLKKEDPDFEKKFLAQAESEGLVGIRGHRTAGGFRASIYNAQEKSNVEKLVQFMEKFEQSERT